MKSYIRYVHEIIVFIVEMFIFIDNTQVIRSVFGFVRFHFEHLKLFNELHRSSREFNDRSSYK